MIKFHPFDGCIFGAKKPHSAKVGIDIVSDPLRSDTGRYENFTAPPFTHDIGSLSAYRKLHMSNKDLAWILPGSGQHFADSDAKVVLDHCLSFYHIDVDETFQSRDLVLADSLICHKFGVAHGPMYWFDYVFKNPKPMQINLWSSIAKLARMFGNMVSCLVPTRLVLLYGMQPKSSTQSESTMVGHGMVLWSNICRLSSRRVSFVHVLILNLV